MEFSNQQVNMKRALERPSDQMRPVTIERGVNKHAEGSVLISFGDTRVLCTASLESGVPSFLRGRGRGWITSEYGMLPRSTHERMDREAARGKQGGRTVEIQRLIGRSLRGCVDMKSIGERTIKLDCDVLQADGGTRTASITGGCIALYEALAGAKLESAWQRFVAAVSVGIVGDDAVLDLEYAQDSNAETDMNVVISESGEFIEVQGTAEGLPFTRPQLNELLDLAEKGCRELVTQQKQALGLS